MDKKGILIGENVKMYGPITIGTNVIIEDDVIIGHPSPQELNNPLFNSLLDYDSLDILYREKTVNATIIGDNSIIRSGSVIYSGCVIGNHFDCGHNVIIREKVMIGEYVYIKPFAYLMTNVKIGNRCRLAGSIADYTVIGNNVSSFGVLTHRRLRRHNDFQSDPTKVPEDTQGPIVEDDCIIGRDAIIVGKVRIGKNSIVGANTFVNFDVPPNSKILGVKGKQWMEDTN